MNQNKIKRLLQNFVGASASVAVVTTVAATNVNIEANFINVTLIENRAYYELNVVEPVIEVTDSSGANPEPMVAELRLNVTNQWDEFSYPLTFGYNAGWIESLRPQQAYTLAIEVNQGSNWRTLATYPLSARTVTAAVIDSLEFVTTPLSTTGTIFASINTQVGARPVDRWEAYFAYGENTYQILLPLGNAQVEIPNVPHINEAISLTVTGYDQDTIVIETSTQLTPMPYVNASMQIAMPTLTTLSLSFNRDLSLTNSQYGVTLTIEDASSSDYLVTDDTLLIDNLQQGETYTLAWWLQYQSSANETETLILSTQLIRVLQTPVYVLSIAPLGQGTMLRLNFEHNLDLTAIFLTIDDEVEPLPFILMETTDTLLIYELYLMTPLAEGTELTLTLVQAEPHDYPISFLSFTFQGGNER